MVTIQLKDLKFKAYHGLYDFEKINGNDFVVNVNVHFTPRVMPIVQLHQTINYAEVYEVVKKRMNTPTELLENVVMDICHLIMQAFPIAEFVFASIEKTKPPIEQYDGSVAVNFQLGRQPQ